MILAKIVYKTVFFTFLFGNKVIKCSTSGEIISDFKTALMYFSEPFLKGAKFDGYPLEGECSITMAQNLVQAIESSEKRYSDIPVLIDLIDFKRQLVAGIPIGQMIKIIGLKNEPDSLQNDAMNFQNEYFMTALDENNGLIVPIGWIGHALALVIKKDRVANTVDLAFVNTGEGIEKHYHSADPDGIYPALSQVWIEFSGIPNDVIFTKDAWFFQGLIALKSQFLEKNLVASSVKSKKSVASDFFYGSFLANFTDYLVAPKPHKLITMQRSGSCTLSSLIGALLYVSKSEEVFYLHKLKIGHAIINNLLDKLRGNSRFKEVIADGFDNSGRHLLRGLAASIAQQALKYLENTLPDNFKHAGLIGSERFKWVFDKKTAAIEALQSDEIIYQNIRTSVQFSVEIIKFLNENPISTSSNEIFISQQTRNEFKSYKREVTRISKDGFQESKNNHAEGETELDGFDDTKSIQINDLSDSEDRENIKEPSKRRDGLRNEDKRITKIVSRLSFYDHLRGDCDNIEDPINTFDEFYNEFKRISTIKIDSKYFYRLMKIFQRARKQGGTAWWHIFGDGDGERFIELMNICMNIASDMNKITPMSFDDISLLAHIQKLSWILAVNYDNRVDEERRIGLEAFNVPRTLQSVLYGCSSHINSLDGDLKSWIVHNIFDHFNYEMFMEIITEEPVNSNMKRFLGPEAFCSPLAQEFNPSLPEQNKEIYHKMMEHPMVEELYIKHTTSRDGASLQQISLQLAKFLIVFSVETSNLKILFPHYYTLMNILAILRLSALGKRNHSSKLYWISSLPNSPEKATQSSYLLFENRKIASNYDSYMRLLTESWENSEKEKTIFYRSRHTFALTSDIDIINIETWQNYMKSAKTAKLFDSIYFQYLTDHILNVPKFNAIGKLMFPIDSIAANQIMKDMSRLIDVTMQRLVDKRSKVSEEKQTVLILRAVNLSIILTRFIQRIDAENVLNGMECARYLSTIYNLMIPFAKLKSDLEIGEENVGKLNLALAFICTISIRNSFSFMNMINLETDIKGLRKTLERYHWFIVKRTYIFKGYGTSIADDQYNYGTSGSPLNAGETNFLQELLRIYFLPALNEKPSDLTSFKYHSNGYIVEMSSINDPSINVMINLWTGAAVRDGLCLIQKNMFIDSKEFQAFFKPEDRIFASNGFTVEVVSGRAVYVLEDFKGSKYLMESNIYDSVKSVFIYRKWKDSWYKHTECACEVSFRNIFNYNHKWIKENSKIYKRISLHNNSDEELLIIPDDAENPVMRFTKNARTSKIMVYVDGLNNDKGWEVLELQSEDDIIPAKRIQKHLDNFTDADYILAKSMEGLVFICLGLRLTDDCKRPLVIAENKFKNSFNILNVNNLEVCINQSIIDGLSIPSTLLIHSESKKSLLLPFIAKSSYTEIERVLVLEEKLAPQTVYQKLLLAYYMIRAYSFDSAKELLQPYTSLAHNEPFSTREIVVLEAILGLEIGAPECIALKLFVFIHYDINSRKFPLNCSRKMREDIIIKCNYILFIYMLSIREIPEKYYIFHVFPEILGDLTFYRVFGNISGFLQSAPDDEANLENDEIDYDSFFSDFSWDDDVSYQVSNESISRIASKQYRTSRTKHQVKYQIGNEFNGNFLRRLISAKNSENYMEFISRIVRRRDDNHSFKNRYEMALFCYVKEPAIRPKFKSCADSKGTRRENDGRDSFKKLLKTCSEKYQRYFKGINQSTEMTTTSLETLRATMQSDINRLTIRVKNDFDYEPIPLVTERDINTFLSTEKTLRELINEGVNNNVSNIMNFDDKTLESSHVLRNLNNSIEKFIDEYGQNCKTEINLYESIDTINQLNNLRLSLNERVNELIQIQETLITELAALITSESHLNIFGSILSSMHRKKSKSFSNLYSCYLTDSLACIQRKFPQLTLRQCKNVQVQAKLFYAQQILIDFLLMLQKSLSLFLEESMQRNPVSIDELANFCAELTKISDFNERMKDPIIMNFEYRSRKYRLRKEQSEDIDILTSFDQTKQVFNSLVIQRMMAAGKTLVLGTISVVKKALHNSTLSILVPPASLYQSNTTAMQNQTYQYFKKKGTTFSFPRFNSNSKGELKNYLKNVNEMLRETMKSNNYLILSPDALSSFLNSYIEFLLISENDSSDSIKVILAHFAKIYRMFKQFGSIILDEIDMTMDPKKELNFPTQETESYNMTAVGLIADIFEFMIFDDNIITAGLKIHSNNQAGLTPDAFITCKSLILGYIRTELEDGTSIWNKFLRTGSYDHISTEDIMLYLENSDMAVGRDWITSLFNNGKELVANALIIIKSQLHNHLESSLKGTVNQNYGASGNLRPEIKFAVPYIAANTPSAASVFADRWETLLKTLLMIGATPCSIETSKALIDYVRISMINETCGIKPVELTITYKNLSLILPSDLNPMSLDKDNINHIKKLHAALSSRSPASIRLLFSFYISQVFYNMTFPTEQISSNALNMISMFGSVQGYSGTIDNVNILPQLVIKYAFKDHEKNEKHNGGISLKLVKDSGDAIIPELSDESFSKNAEALVSDLLNLNISHINNVSAIIDTGAFFKNFKNKRVAEAILNVLGKTIDTVLFYDEESNQLEFLRSEGNASINRGILETTDPDYITKTTGTNLKLRFTFYDQRHITGSDILQPKFAHAILTIGPRVLLRDILQGALRMRQFMTSQKVHLISTKSSRNFYSDRISMERSQLNVSDILALGSLNEDEKQEHENEKLAFGKIDAEIREFVIDELSRFLLDNIGNQNVDEFIINSIKNVKVLFLRSIREKPLSWLRESKYEETEKVLNVFTVSRLHKIKKIMKYFEATNSIHQRFNSLKKRLKYMINPKNKKTPDCLLNYTKELIRSPLNLDIGTEVQQQTLTLILVDVSMETLVETKIPIPVSIEHDYRLVESLALQENDLYLISNDIYSTLRELYNSQLPNPVYMPYVNNTLITNGQNVAVTKDLTHIVRSGAGNAANPIFSKYTLEGSHFLVQACPLSLKVILLSPKHASIILKNLKKYDFIHHKFWICDLSGAITATNGNSDENGENIMDFIPQSKIMIFDLLVFNGSFDQIISNISLKDIYERVWMLSEYSKERAIFLRMRMNILMGKDMEMFEEDDGDIGMLRNYSLGGSDPSISEVLMDGYPKQTVNSEHESKFSLRLGLKSITGELEQVKEKINFNLNQEIELLFGFEFESNDTQLIIPEIGLRSSLILENVDLDVSETLKKSRDERPVLKFPLYPEETGTDSIISSSIDVAMEMDDDPVINFEIDVDDEMPDFYKPDNNYDIAPKYIIDTDFM